MEDYDSLLENAYKKIKQIEVKTERFEIPKVSGMVEGKNTIIINMASISDYIRRPMDEISKFLSREMAIPGKVEKDRLVLKGRFSSAKINEKLESYVKEFVLCNECKKPDTEVISEKGIKFKHCLACGAKSPLRRI